MNEILEYFNKIGVKLTDDKGQLRDQKNIIDDIVKTRQGFDRIVAINELNSYINSQKG